MELLWHEISIEFWNYGGKGMSDIGVRPAESTVDLYTFCLTNKNQNKMFLKFYGLIPWVHISTMASMYWLEVEELSSCLSILAKVHHGAQGAV